MRHVAKRPKNPKAPKTTQAPQMAEAVEVLPGQRSIEGADTPAEVHASAVNAFDTLPAGYATEIQPMRKYTDAEEWALNESLRLYGFFGTILRDQFGRTLDGHHRERLARLRGLGVSFVVRHVKDDDEAMAIARAANAVRRHSYTQEQRQELANGLRDQGFTYEAIAEALGVGKATVYRDIMGVLRVRAEEIVPMEQSSANGAEIVPMEQSPVSPPAISPVDQSRPSREEIEIVTQWAAREDAAQPAKRVQRKGGGTYPAQRTTTPKTPATTRFDVEDRQTKLKALYMDWLKHCQDEAELETAQFFLNDLSDLAIGRGMQLEHK